MKGYGPIISIMVRVSCSIRMVVFILENSKMEVPVDLVFLIKIMGLSMLDFGNKENSKDLEKNNGLMVAIMKGFTKQVKKKTAVNTGGLIIIDMLANGP